MTINNAQQELLNMLSRVAYPRLGTVIGLQEEIGKLCKVVIDKEIYNKPSDPERMKNSCADLFLALIDVCNAYDVELEMVVENKINEVKDKVDSWEKEHGEQLNKSRSKLDE